MSNICKFTVPASRDIETIIDYIAENSSFDAAESLLSKINSKCTRLAKFPGMGLFCLNQDFHDLRIFRI